MRKLFFFVFFFITFPSFSQTFYSNPFTHTYSIIARDSITGEMGIAVESHWFSVGSVVCWGEAGVGVVATQSFANESFGILGIELLKQGKTPQEALNILIARDSSSEVRQVAILDVRGRTAAYTGINCIAEAGHLTGKNYAVQANLMLNNKVWPAMAKTFRESKGSLAERLIQSLESGENAGGDIRGKQSAAILIVKGVSTGKPWEDKVMDLRVEDHKEPVQELKRLVKIHKAYAHMAKGDEAIESNNLETALKEYLAAENLMPDNIELKFWRAVTFVNKGKLMEALPVFKKVFRKNANYAALIPRLNKAGLITATDVEIEKIMSVR